MTVKREKWGEEVNGVVKERGGAVTEMGQSNDGVARVLPVPTNLSQPGKCANNKVFISHAH